MRTWLVRLVAVAILVGAAWGFWRYLRPTEEMEIRTATLTRGDLCLTVTATGHLAPTTEVLVGCEVSGTVGEVMVDHNDRVRRNQVIARLKPESYQAEYEQARADLARAKAQVRQLEVQEREAKRQFDRVANLRKTGAASDQEYDALLAEYDAAKASAAAGRAAVQGAEGRLELARYRLDRTVITSPIDGIVLDRRVDVGQTVVAALQAPTMFVLAEDLTHMRLLADVSEGDVGYICPGQVATFTVNTYRDRTFEGRVRQIRNQPTSAGNVVTYTVVIDVANRDLLLRPGMPADVTIEIVRRTDVPTITNAALRFRPPMRPDEVRRMLEEVKWPDPPKPIEVLAAIASRPADAGFVPPPIEPVKATLWTFAAGRWRPVPVWTLFTDNRDTAIATGPDVTDATEFVTEVRRHEGSGSALQRAIMLARPENRKL